jgi:pimeloyl-ACP methyl ester carboxylesterase
MTRLHLVGLTLAASFLASSCAADRDPSNRIVDIAAADGAALKGTYFSAGAPGPGVLLLHQCNRQRKVWDALGQQLAAAGLNVLTVDLRGFGESSGARFDVSKPSEARALREKWPADIDVAFQYLSSQPGVTRDTIGVGGASCGVDNSVQTARRHPEQVKSLVLLSGPTDLAGRQFLRQARQLPVLAAVADDDEFRETVEIMPWVFSLSASPAKRFVHYDRGGHGADMFSVHPELQKEILDWYVATLKQPGSTPAAKDTSAVPASTEMLALIDQPGGAREAQRKLAEARQHDPAAVLFSETIVNIMGYEHLQNGDVAGAAEIMTLNVTAFAQSPNAQDSLADALLAAGDKERARRAATQALELLASDTVDPPARRALIRESAQQKLTQLGAKPK